MSLVLLLGAALTLGQPAPTEGNAGQEMYLPYRGRTLKMSIEYPDPEKRKTLKQIQLCVSRDKGQTWEVADAVPPEKDFMLYSAREDGLYWFTFVFVYVDGTKQPADVSKMLPAQKVLWKTTPPVVRIVSAKRDGDDVVLEWNVEEKFPNDSMTQVSYRAAGATDWTTIPSTAIVRRTAKFRPNGAGPIVVQVAAQDLAGNVGSVRREISVASMSAYTPPANDTPPARGSEPIAPTALPETPAPSSAIRAPVMTPAPTEAPPVSPPPAPSMPTTPVMPPAAPSETTPQPMPVWNTQNPGSAPQPAADPVNTQVINVLKFDLQYQLDVGPSGVASVDLYVTRDDGRSWVKWSRHDGKESPLRVQLDMPFNREREGDYGFRLVPVSGAGLSDGAPTSGSTPEMRVHVDLTPPIIRPYQPTPDANLKNALVLRWEASDRNFGREPIAIEWSELAAGPWRSVTAAEGFQPASGTTAPIGRLPNTGSYSWQLPTNMGTHKVYLKFTAWDAAGNKSEVVTQSPVLVDLTKPKAKIQGILTPR